MRCRAANAKTINWECTQAIRLEILKLGQATKGQTNTIGGSRLIEIALTAKSKRRGSRSEK
jgi:hypothetical protein